jgi:hypothetical protein
LEITMRLQLPVVLLATLLAGCDLLAPATPIKEVLSAPAAFEGKEVRLKGKVKDVTKIPLVDIKAYTLQDETGEIVVTTDGALPAQGAELRLRGRVESAAIVGGQSLGLRVRELERP